MPIASGTAPGTAPRRLALAVLAALTCFAAAGSADAQISGPIAVINADGTGQRTIGQLPAVRQPPGLFYPTPPPVRNPWSHDNTEIAFVGAGPAIYALGVDTGSQRRLTAGPGYLAGRPPPRCSSTPRIPTPPTARRCG